MTKLLTVSRQIAFRLLTLLRFTFILIAITVSSTAKAQLCTGSLGDPVVNMKFDGLSTAGIGPGYSYTSGTCPNDGFYTITRAESGCFGNTWSTVTDHTGDGSGFMLVNASFNPGDFFVTTVADLCPNTTYEFASWIMNVMIPAIGIKPNITFNIETPGGTVLQSFNTGDIGLIGVWKQYGFFFTTPANNAQVVLRMTNNAPGGYGNDLALDDITFRPCGATITAQITGQPTDTVDICEGNTSTYSFNGVASAAYSSPVYQWQVSNDKGNTWKDIPGANTTTFVRSPTVTPGNYWYRMAVTEASSANISSCRIASNYVIVNVHPKPIVDAGADRVMLEGNPIMLKAKAEGEGISFYWSPPDYMDDPTIVQPTVSPVSGEIRYTLYAESSFGCDNSDMTVVKVVSGIYVPTAFTPNGDGKNDTWEIPYLDPSFGAEVSLFNRWGQLVYHVNAAKVSWDGKIRGVEQGSGAYIYMITAKSIHLNMKGTVMLIR